MYDPLIRRTIAPHQAQVASYWAKSRPRPNYPPLNTSVNTDVAIIGAGYTGMGCAEALAERGVDCVLIDANQPGWGCSGRNAGFALASTGRLGLASIQARWGQEAADVLYREYHLALERLRERIAPEQIQACGYLKLAHNDKALAGLQAQATLLQQRYDDGVQILAAGQLAEHIGQVNAVGGIIHPYCFATDPLAFALDQAKALAKRVPVFGDSPATAIMDEGQGYRILTLNGEIRANKVVVASNAYTPKGFHQQTDNKQFPVLSSVLVTRPLSEAELDSNGFHKPFMAMDTRPMKYYYRLLPDNRLLFGGRGAILGKHADAPAVRTALLNAVKSTFPGLEAVTTEHFWSGWVSVSWDDMPRVSQVPGRPLYLAMGYCGAGLAFSGHAGRRLAQMITNDLPAPLQHHPLYQSQLQPFPLSAFRRFGLWGYYQWMALQQRFS